MNKDKQEKIYYFLEEVTRNINSGMSLRDAMLITSVTMDKDMAALVSQADIKYQEATYTKTELSQQRNIDECALASMGKLWHGENFEGSTEQIESSDEEILLDTFYFIFKYANSDDPLRESLDANNSVCGDKIMRKVFLEKIFKF